MENYIDIIIIIVYLISVALFGIYSGGKQKNIKDYFLGSGKVPWYAVMFSIVAAETSTLTFISIPGLAYIGNFNFLQVTVGYLLGRIFIAIFFLPKYFEGELDTAYQYLQIRFGKKIRYYSSFIFLITRTAADGVRLFATAIPLKLMLDIGYPEAIIVIAFISLIYTYTGGVKGVIWVDVIQMFIYIGGAVISIFFLLNSDLNNSVGELYTMLNTSGKLNIVNWGFDLSFAEFFKEPYTLFGGIIGGAFLSMASHGTDQMIVQRLLTTKDLKSARKSIVGSGIIIIFQFVIFLTVGALLYLYYNATEYRSDEIFPKYIIEQLPVGVTGIIIAGLFAAAMSTIAGSISSLSSSTMLDIVNPFFKDKKYDPLKISRLVTIGWAILLIFSAFFFMNSSKAVVEIALSIASFTYGGLLGTFLLGIFNKKIKEKGALISFSAGILFMTFLILLKIVAWTWFTFIGVLITITVGYLITKITKET